MPDTTFSNSYIGTDAILETYIGGDPRAAAIALKAASATTQEWYCNRATDIIDALPLQGYPLTSSQSRAFPRKYVPSHPITESPWGSTVNEDAYGYIYMSSSVPQDVIDACCEEAIAQYAYEAGTDGQKAAANARKAGLRSISLEGLSKTFGPITDRGGLRSEEAYNILKKYMENSVFVR